MTNTAAQNEKRKRNKDRHERPVNAAVSCQPIRVPAAAIFKEWAGKWTSRRTHPTQGLGRFPQKVAGTGAGGGAPTPDLRLP
jgi:hypothetical protein